MHFLTGWFIRNPVAANLLMAFILFMGILTLDTIRIEGFPRIPPENINIETVYPNASAEKVDNLISRKIESALEGLEGVRSLTSLSQNGVSIVSVRRAGGQDINKLLDKVRIRMESGIELPRAAERPRIETDSFNIPALYINVYGDTDPRTLHALAKRLKDDLLAEPELSRLDIWGLHKQEMRIEIADQQLQKLNMTIADVMEKIQRHSLQYGVGALKTDSGKIYLKTDNQAEFSPDFAEISILTQKNGSEVLLGDIADIQDTFADNDYLFKFNGELTSGMAVKVGSKENLLLISEVAHSVVDEFRKQLPDGVDVQIWGSSASYISDRLNLLASNGIQGLLLVAFILALFLNVKLAFWVAMGIPISVMGAMTIAGTSWVDYSLNDITTFGFIIALGILVDDAVVVGESVFEQRRIDPDPVTGTEKGVEKVAVATVFGVLTTIAAFFPMLLLDNPLGKVLAGFSGVVIFALFFSLLESKFILPAHLAHIDIAKQSQWRLAKAWGLIQNKAQQSLYFARDRLYAPLLEKTIHHRYAALVLFISMGSLCIGLTMQGKVKTVFFPDVPGQVINVNLEMDSRSPFQLTKGNVEKIEKIGNALNKELQIKYQLESPPIRTLFSAISNAESAELYAELVPLAERTGVEIGALINQWRERIGSLEGVTALQLTGSEAVGGGFKIKLASRDIAVLKAASKELKEYLQSVDGVHNLRETFASGQAELKVAIKPEAESLGFDTQTLARQVSNAFGGAEAQKIQRGTTETRVLVLRAANERNNIDDLLRSLIKSPDGQWIPVSAIAKIEGHFVPKTRYRENNRLVNEISASIDRSKVAPEEIAQAVFEQLAPELKTRYPALKISGAGELEEIGEIRGGLKKALLIATILIYVLMAVPLKSYWQPFVILAIIPFGFVGAIIGHIYMDLSLSLLSLFGMLALAGVVVNDSLVMLTRYNQACEEGMDRAKAIMEAAISRFQAIFLTTATTVIGLMPLLSETSEQAQYLIPAAASLAFGELFSTVLMLLLVPVLIAITNDCKNLLIKAGFFAPQGERACSASH